jgi:triphosphoribosyl-dephospho-CoA synthase
MATLCADVCRRAFVEACELDVAVRKPGNVSVASPGHRMDAGMFIASANAAATPLCEPDRRVGQRIEGALKATLAVVGCNTNLGILLLCAPLACAWVNCEPGAAVPELRAALERVLAGLDVADAQATYRAIALANPAGLGTAAQQDVAQTPTVGLREAMALAAARDRIAYQYATAFADLFDLGLPAFLAALPDRKQALQRVYLEYLAAWPDSHIVRKQGEAVAHSVMAEARPWRARSRSGTVLDVDTSFAAWDDSLKTRGINPGTSADLSVATALIAGLLAG